MKQRGTPFGSRKRLIKAWFAMQQIALYVGFAGEVEGLKSEITRCNEVRLRPAVVAVKRLNCVSCFNGHSGRTYSNSSRSNGVHLAAI